jgi:outer membrane protein assembly factor BamB
MNTITRFRLSKLIVNSMFSFLLTLLFLVQSFFNAPILAQDSELWPQFRGNNCSGLAIDARPPIELNESTLQWKTPLPKGHSSPCIAGDNIFVTAQIDSAELQTLCIDKNTGEIMWAQSIFPEKMEGYHSISNAAQTSPATDGERVYVYFGSHGVLCYDIKGKFLWEYKVPVHWYHWGVASSPVVYEDKVIISRDLKNKWYLLALDKYTGESVWKTNMGDPKVPWSNNWTTPVIYRKQVILHRNNSISSFSVVDGKLLWKFPHMTAGVSTPVINDSVIYIGTWHNYGEKELRSNFPDYLQFSEMLRDFDLNKDSLIQEEEAPDTLYVFDRPEIHNFDNTTQSSVKKYFSFFDKDKSGAIDKMEWESKTNWIKYDFYKEAGLIALVPSDTGILSLKHVLWKEPEKTPEVPSPIYCNNKIYMCKNGGILTCMDAITGKIYFRQRIGVSGPYFSSPVAANGKIYIAANNGRITVIEASDTLEIVAINDIEDKIFATPAILGDKIYIRTAKYLFAFGQPEDQALIKQ